MTKSKSQKVSSVANKKTAKPAEEKNTTKSGQKVSLKASEILKRPVMAKFRTKKTDFMENLLSKTSPKTKK